jgi:hypothetical protein
LSGYIPYEGPDTQTTNGYVLKATAPSPRHYDPSIPEPLAAVTMKALSPDTKVRYKDGQEAEEALKRAWENCLRDGLILPQALAADEVPHERVGKEMHATAAASAQQPGTTQKDVLVIESSSGDPDDDDPTTIMIRDGDTAIEDIAALGKNDLDPTVLGHKKDKAASAGRKASTRGEDRIQTADTGGDIRPSRTGFWVALLLVALALGGAAAFYLMKG